MPDPLLGLLLFVIGFFLGARYCAFCAERGRPIVYRKSTRVGVLLLLAVAAAALVALGEVP